MRDTLFFDGQCGMCRRSVRIIRAMDWLGRLNYRDSTTTPPDELPVRFDVAMQGIPMRTRHGRTLIGFAAIRRALAQTPLGVLPAMLLYVPGISHVGRIVYRGIAARRNRSAAACAIDTGTR